MGESRTETARKPGPAGAVAEGASWHALEAPSVMERLVAREEGLGGAEAAEGLARHGANRVDGTRPEGPLRLLLRQFDSPLLFVLLGAGGIALALGKVTDGAVVLGVVVLNAVLGWVQEHRAQRAITALGRMVPESATVRREGRLVQVPAAEVVPGDIVLLRSGDRVPADLRLFSVRNLQVDESALTGEAVPVAKQILAVPRDAPLGDRSCMAYGGTLATSGTGIGVVVATGSATELGRISTMLRRTEVLATPLTRSMARVGRGLTFAVLGVSAVLFGIGWMRGYAVADAAVAAISLAVAAIPEGLPAIITIALAIGVRRMARRRVIIRSLPAVETLGSTTVICTDKTGTLTRNEMTVQAVWAPEGTFQVSGAGYSPEGHLSRDGDPVDRPPAGVVDVLRAGALCNDSALSRTADGRWTAEGDPTEVALLVAARKGGLDGEALASQWPRVDTVPFESERQIMGTLHRGPDGGQVILVKGAPEVVLQRCDPGGAGGRPAQAQVRAAVEAMAGTGLRVLAMASRILRQPQDRLEERDLQEGFRFLGLQGMSDPPREEAVAAVEACRRAGIRVSMITGDHGATAAAIGRHLGLGRDGPVVTGGELATLSDDDLGPVAASTDVFARVAPEHKLRLVRALQERGEVVAMTGDGVNDAPALRRADIGVAMGITGTAVSRQAADMVLTDDNFASIVAAVEEGRRVFDNLVKSLVFVLPTNLGEALVILAAVLFFPLVGGQPTMPILPVQILWVNLVATVALALPLAFEAREPDLMDRPPRAPGAPMLDAFVLARTAWVAVLMAAGAIGLFLVELGLAARGGTDAATATREAQTAAVTAIVAFQIVYLFCCRSLGRSAVGPGFLGNPVAFAGVGAVLVLQAVFVYAPPMQHLFGTAPLGPDAWIRAFAVGATAWPAVRLEKFLRAGRTGTPRGPAGRPADRPPVPGEAALETARKAE